MTMHSLLRFSPLLLALGAVSPPASANDGTPPRIQDLVQRGQDVDITLSIVDEGEPDLSVPYTVTRTGSDGEEADVVDGQTFSTGEADSNGGPDCRWWEGEDPAFCTADPGACVDCDGDGTPECYGWCETAWYFVVTDACVPPGTTTWTLLADQGGSLDALDEKSLDVTDAGVECRAGCGCGSPGGSTRPLALAGLFTVGCVALLGGRRRRP